MKRLAARLKITGKHPATLVHLNAEFDGPLGALAQLISDLRVLELIATLPGRVSHLVAETEGILERLGRIDFRELPEMEPQYKAALENHTLNEERITLLIEHLNYVLQRHAKGYANRA